MTTEDDRLYLIDDLARICGFFHGDVDANNGYGCDHPDQEEREEGIGCCFAMSCPLGFNLDPTDPEDAVLLAARNADGSEDYVLLHEPEEVEAALREEGKA